MKYLKEISAHEDNIRNPLMLLNCFLNSAMCLHGNGFDESQKEISSSYIIVAFYLYRHAIEIGLKALIYEIKKEKKYGRNIKNLWDRIKNEFKEDGIFYKNMNEAIDILDLFNQVENEQLIHYTEKDNNNEERDLLSNLPPITNEKIDRISECAWSVYQTILEFIGSSKNSVFAKDDIPDKRIIACLDILGFKNCLKENKLEKIYRAYQSAADTCTRWYARRMKEMRFWKSIPTCHIFSDSIILISESATEDDLKVMINYAKIFIQVFNCHQLPLRGAIGAGEVIAEESFFMGKAFVDAFDLEKCQNWIGAIIDPALNNMVDDNGEVIKYKAPIKDNGGFALSKFSAKDVENLKELLGSYFSRIQLIDENKSDYKKLSFTKYEILDIKNRLHHTENDKGKYLSEKLVEKSEFKNETDFWCVNFLDEIGQDYRGLDEREATSIPKIIKEFIQNSLEKNKNCKEIFEKYQNTLNFIEHIEKLWRDKTVGKNDFFEKCSVLVPDKAENTAM